MMDGSVRVFESGAIMLHLAQKHPEAGLYSEVGVHSRVPVVFHSYVQQSLQYIVKCLVLFACMLLFELCVVRFVQ